MANLSKKEALQYVGERLDVDGHRAERRPLEQLWFENEAYFAGAQHFVVDKGRIRYPNHRNPNREWFQANRILPKVFRAVSKLLQTNAQFRVSPKSGDREDRHAAKVGEQVFDHLRQVTDYEEKQFRAILWAAICGSGFLKVTWDPDAGTPQRVYFQEGGDRVPDIAPLYDAHMRQEREQKGLYEDIKPGEVNLEVVSPFQMHWDHAARDGGIDDCNWVAQVSAMDVDDIYDHFGVRVAPQGKEPSGARLYEETIANLTTGLKMGTTGTSSTERSDQRAQVVEFFERPLKRNDWKGRYILMAGNQVIRSEENPYAASGTPLPFIKVDWFKMPGKFTGLSLVEQLRPSQKAYNRARSHSIEYQKTYGFAPVFLPKGSGVKPVQLTSLPGVAYEFNSALGAPIFGSPPNLPPYIMQNAEIARGEMDEISAQSDPSNNKLPGQLRSGTAIQMMQAENNAILTPTSKSVINATVEVGTQMLQLVGLYYTEPRVVQTIGTGGELDVHHFSGADLRGQYNLRVFGEPGTLESSESYKATLMDLAQMGVLNPQDPAEKMLILKAVHYKTSNDLVNAKLQQEEAEEREVERMVNDSSYLAAPEAWQNAGVRLSVLERYLNSQEFERLDEMTQSKIKARWEGFTAIMQQQMQAQMQMMAMQRGAPGETGQASQPSPK